MDLSSASVLSGQHEHRGDDGVLFRDHKICLGAERSSRQKIRFPGQKIRFPGQKIRFFALLVSPPHFMDLSDGSMLSGQQEHGGDDGVLFRHHKSCLGVERTQQRWRAATWHFPSPPRIPLLPCSGRRWFACVAEHYTRGILNTLETMGLL